MSQGTNLLWELVQIGAALAVVLGLAWVILRFGLPRLLTAGQSRGVPIDVLGIRPLDRQVKLAVVVAEGRRFLLAFGPGGVTALSSRAVEEAAATDGADAERQPDGGVPGERGGAGRAPA
ncbi:MAG: flagellar biosynthetic protein FliO [Thermoanaerobaculia bacterium]